MAWTATYDVNFTENRLYVKMAGAMTLKEIDEYSLKFMTEVYKLKKGFTILFDVREQAAMEPAAAAKIEPNVAKCVAHGMKKYAWVVNSAVLKGQMKRCYDAKAGVETGFFDSIEEAKKFLNE